jgi:hypothetical protein
MVFQLQCLDLQVDRNVFLVFFSFQKKEKQEQTLLDMRELEIWQARCGIV